MKYYTGNAVFKYTWDQIAYGFWNRYPNPYSTHVLSEDTICRHISNGKLISRRLLSKTNKLPKWGERFVPGSKSCFVVEESIVDPKNKTITTYTRNIALTTVMSVEEKCVYAPSSENKNWTEVKREAWINSSVYGFSFAIQVFAHDRFKKNAIKTIKGFEHVLSKLYIPESIPEPGKLHLKADVIRKRAAKKASDIAKAATGVVTN